MSASIAFSTASVHGPEDYWLRDRRAARYWVEPQRTFTGDPHIDYGLSSFPVAIFQPNRPAADTPIVVGLQGIGAPMEFNDFIVPQLLDMGIAVILFDTFMAGKRRVLRDQSGDMLDDLGEMARRGYALSADWMGTLFAATADDTRVALRLAAERHGLTSDRVALFGISFGALLHSGAFSKHGVGRRLLCVGGHADLSAMARGFSLSWFIRKAGPVLTSRPFRSILCRKILGLAVLLDVLDSLVADPDKYRAVNPITYADQVDGGRRARFLVGENDWIAAPREAERCAGQFGDGACYVVPDMSHDRFVEHTPYFLATQLGDWAW